MPSPQLGHQHFLTFLVHDLLAEEVEFVDGNITVPTGPGLGIELNEEVAERHPYSGSKLHLEMTSTPIP